MVKNQARIFPGQAEAVNYLLFMIVFMIVCLTETCLQVVGFVVGLQVMTMKTQQPCGFPDSTCDAEVASSNLVASIFLFMRVSGFPGTCFFWD